MWTGNTDTNVRLRREPLYNFFLKHKRRSALSGYLELVYSSWNTKYVTEWIPAGTRLLFIDVCCGAADACLQGESTAL
jgi:hypothetical protein